MNLSLNEFQRAEVLELKEVIREETGITLSLAGTVAWAVKTCLERRTQPEIVDRDTA